MIRFIKRAIVKWALKEIVTALHKHPDVSFGGLETIGLEDYSYIREYNEYHLVVASHFPRPAEKEVKQPATLVMGQKLNIGVQSEDTNTMQDQQKA